MQSQRDLEIFVLTNNGQLIPERILDVVYRFIKLCRNMGPQGALEKLKTKKGINDAAIIVYAFSKIFNVFNDAQLTSLFNDAQLNNYINSLNAQVKRQLDRVINKAKLLHQRLECDVLNTRDVEAIIAEQPVTPKQLMQKFHEYVNKKWASKTLGEADIDNEQGLEDIHSLSPTETITVYLTPPKEIRNVIDGVADLNKELFNKYQGSAFIYNNSLYRLYDNSSLEYERYELFGNRFENKKTAESFKKLLKDHHRPTSDVYGIVMPERDFNHVLGFGSKNLLVLNKDIHPEVRARIDATKTNTWKLDNDYSLAVAQLQEKLLSIKTWGHTRRTMHEIPVAMKERWNADADSVLVNEINFVAVDSLEELKNLPASRLDMPGVIRKLPSSKLTLCSQFTIRSDRDEDIWNKEIEKLINSNSKKRETFLVKMAGDDNRYVFYYPHAKDRYGAVTLTLKPDQLKALNHLPKDRMISPFDLERESQTLFHRLSKYDEGFKDEFYLYGSKNGHDWETTEISSLLNPNEFNQFANQFKNLGSLPTVVRKPNIIFKQKLFNKLKEGHQNLAGEMVKPYVPTPVKNILNKIEKTHDPANYKGLILKEIANLGLTESVNHKNTSAEKEFYGIIADVIDLDATFKRIADEIILKFGPIDVTNVPPGVKQIYELCFENWKQSPKERLISILRLAKEKRGDFLKNMFLRENKTKELYNNIENFIIVKKGADLEKAMQAITAPDAFVPSVIRDKDFIFNQVIKEKDKETREIMKTWKGELLRTALRNLGFSTTKNDFTPKEAKLLHDQLSTIVYSYGSVVPLFDPDYKSKSELRIKCENFLKYLLTGKPFSIDNLDWRLKKALFNEKDHEFIKEFRNTTEVIFITMFQNIKKLERENNLNEYQEKQLEMQIANILGIYTFFDPHKEKAGKTIKIPQKVDNKWKLVDFELVPIELKFDEKWKHLFVNDDGTVIDENYPVYAYLLKPDPNQYESATPYLLFMGTPPDTSQGVYYAKLADFDLEDPKTGRYYSIGERMYMANREHIQKVLEKHHIKQAIVSGQSLGAIFGLFFALDKIELCKVVYALNPPAVEPETFKHGPEKDGSWKGMNSPDMNKVYVQVQERDIVNQLFQIGIWHKDWNLLNFRMLEPLTVPGLAQFITHLRTFANVPYHPGKSGSIAMRRDPIQDNKKRSEATFRQGLKTNVLDPVNTSIVTDTLETAKSKASKKP